MAEKKSQQLPPLRDTLVPPKKDDLLECDELWSFVGKKTQPRWIWLSLCRRTRQVVSYAIGSREEREAWHLREGIPPSYESCRTVSDAYPPYQTVFDADKHTSFLKKQGQTNHVERFNNTLRQRLSRLTRKTLSFSKSDLMHQATISLFLDAYNRDSS